MKAGHSNGLDILDDKTIRRYQKIIIKEINSTYWVCGRSITSDDRDDLMQDCFVKLLEAYDRGYVDREDPVGLLIYITANTAIDKLRRARRKNVDIDDIQIPVKSDPIVLIDLNKKLDELPDVWQLYLLEDVETQAEAHDVSHMTVRRVLYDLAA